MALSSLHQESIMVSVSGGDQLHIKRLLQDKKSPGKPVFMLHGEAEDGRVFYSPGRSGLANFLAMQGYDVYVADMRGKGKSWPAIGERSDFGYHEVITIDIPALVRAIERKRPDQTQIWISHGIGGVLMLSSFARMPELTDNVERMAHFGIRRKIAVDNWKKRFVIDWLWLKASERLVRWNGYLPAKSLRLGTMDESARSYYDNVQWLAADQWRDPQDDFDYANAILQSQLPPSLYFAAAGELAYSHPDDVRAFIHQLGGHDGRFVVLSEQGGNLQDYDHVDMLMHRDARHDHFPLLLEWLENSTTSWQSQEQSQEDTLEAV